MQTSDRWDRLTFSRSFGDDCVEGLFRVLGQRGLDLDLGLHSGLNTDPRRVAHQPTEFILICCRVASLGVPTIFMIWTSWSALSRPRNNG